MPNLNYQGLSDLISQSREANEEEAKDLCKHAGAHRYRAWKCKI